jgi:catechol 2,3-dioxygenase-like lactoylglutathione lyase family enzyme
MPLERLDHYFVYAADLEETARFYEEALGLTRGPRPDFGFPGFWFYLDERPVVHVGTPGFEGGYNEDDKPHSTSGSTGAVDHIAFNGTDMAGFEARFTAMSIEFRKREIPDFGLSQLFAKDPNGVTIELNFFAAP